MLFITALICALSLIVHRYYFFSSISRLQEEKIAYKQKIAKMEAEMKALFNQKVQEKEKKLKESETEVILVDLYLLTFMC